MQPLHFNIIHLYRLNANERAHKVLDSIPEFAAFRETYAHIDAPLAPNAEPNFNALAARLRDGEDITVLATEANAAARNRELAASAADIRIRAAGRYDVDFEGFLATRQSDISERVLAEYRALVDQAKTVVPKLAGVHEISETLGNPDASMAWPALYALAQELDAWQETALLLWGKRHDNAAVPGPRHILAEFEAAWPDFHRVRESARADARDSRVTLDAVPVPWPDTFTLLRDIAERDLKIWAPTSAEYDAEQQRLSEIAEDRRDADFKTLMAGGTVNASNTAFHTF